MSDAKIKHVHTFTHVVASLITKFKSQTFISKLKLHTALYSFVLESIHIEVYSKNLLWMCFLVADKKIGKKWKTLEADNNIHYFPIPHRVNASKNLAFFIQLQWGANNLTTSGVTLICISAKIFQVFKINIILVPHIHGNT